MQGLHVEQAISGYRKQQVKYTHRETLLLLKLLLLTQYLGNTITEYGHDNKTS